MMDFQQLAAAQQSSPLASGRRQKSLDLCQLGFTCLAEAQLGSFRNKGLLRQACDALISAIQHCRTNADAYLGMGYLLFLIGDYGQARAYLSEALRLSPGNPDAQAIIAQMNTDKVSPPMSGPGPSLTLPPLPVPGQAVDSDALYDQLELRICAILRAIMAEPPLPAATVEPETIAALGRKHQELAGTVQAINQQLGFLARELDTSELRHKSKPLEIQLRRLDGLIGACHKLVEVKSRLEDESETIAQMAVKAQFASDAGDVLELEAGLEQLLDFCDQMADELDRLDEKGYSILTVEPGYAQLIARLEELQDQVDEAAERLGAKAA